MYTTTSKRGGVFGPCAATGLAFRSLMCEPVLVCKRVNLLAALFATRGSGLFGVEDSGLGTFRKIRVPYSGVLIRRILLFRVLYERVPYVLNPPPPFRGLGFSGSLGPVMGSGSCDL